MATDFKLMVTGHRPDKLGGYRPNRTRDYVRQELLTILKKYKEQHGDSLVAISGMAIGVDQWWAEIAIELGIRVHAYVPFKGQERKWPKDVQEHYTELIEKCEEIVVVSEGGYEAKKMQVRNERMVDDADECVAVFNGSRGGTANCVRYIESTGKPLTLVEP